jgi:hypothetical protein
MSGDRDLEELVKAIEKGDKERAIIIAKTLFKRRYDPVINWFGQLGLLMLALQAERWLRNLLSKALQEAQ